MHDYTHLPPPRCTGSLETMFELYKALLPELGGYLTHAGKLHRGRLETFLQKLANLEAKVLLERAQVTSHAAQYEGSHSKLAAVLSPERLDCMHWRRACHQQKRAGRAWDLEVLGSMLWHAHRAASRAGESQWTAGVPWFLSFPNGIPTSFPLPVHFLSSTLSF